MQTINYQGQEIEATLVNYLSGVIPTSTVDMDGDEKLFRDGAGRYYLQREMTWLDADAKREASGRTLTHRININAAVLWATTRINSETLDLRADAAKLIMEGRDYRDPHPVHLNAAKRNGPPATPKVIAFPSVPHRSTAAETDDVKAPNVQVTTEVPPDFAEHAYRLGYTPEYLLWLLAEDVCAQRPTAIEEIVAAAPESDEVFAHGEEAV